MNTKTLYLFAILTIFLASCQANTQNIEDYQPGETAIPNPPITPSPVITPISEEDVIQLAWFYKPPEDGSSLSVLSQYFDFFILTHYDEDERDELKALGVNKPFLEYLLFVQIQDPGSCQEEPYGNQVAYKTGDFCTLLSEHPDWFLRDKSGAIIRKEKTVYMDPGSAGYREFWLERARELQEDFGWDGIFIDNVEASLNKFRRLDILPEKYPNDESYQAEINEFLTYIRVSYFEPKGRPMYANIVEYSDDAVWLRYLQQLDGVMIEDFSVGYNERYYTASEWEKQINIVSQAQASGKPVIMVSQGALNDTARERFALASYLLVNNGLSAFRYTNSDYYEDVWLYENYLVQLGSPTGTMYQDNGGWRRDFTNGYVFVDPSSRTGQISLSE